ncbi:hypothetical protein WVI01_05860 [Weissella viridescens]|uniref:hypothetical protein n=1 Tax=Weissella viridescens TaxID=1629 RepID=UPI00070BA91E|nr:hypothetical protein [Weissella viridescens]GEA94663.1 hypothetical protein WVI01_05860 [Weissella viridescens]
MPKPKRNWVIWVLLVILLLTMAFGSYYIQNVQHARLQKQQNQTATVGRESPTVQVARRDLQRADISTKHVSTAQMQRIINAAKQADVSVVTYAKKHPNTLN